MRALTCLVIALVSVVCLPAGGMRAEADVSKAWTAAKDNLPASTRAVGAIDIAAAVKASSYAKLLAFALKEEKDLDQMYSLIKKTCKFDPVTAVEGIVVAGTPDGDQAVVFLQLTVDRAKVTACVDAAIKAIGEKATVKADGMFTSVTFGKDSLYAAWVTPDVVAISSEPDKKQMLQAWIGNKGALAKTNVMAQLAKVDTKAIAWGGFAFDKPLDDDDLKVVTGFGTVTFANATLATTIRGTFADAKSANLTLGKMQKDLAKEIDRKRTPEAVKKVLRLVKLSANGAELTLKGSVSEADFLAAVLSTFTK